MRKRPPHPQEVLCWVYCRPSQHCVYSGIPFSFPQFQREAMVPFNPLLAACIPPPPPPPHFSACAVRLHTCVVCTGSAGSWKKAIPFYLPIPVVRRSAQVRNQTFRPASRSSFSLNQCAHGVSQLHLDSLDSHRSPVPVMPYGTSNVPAFRSWLVCAHASQLHRTHS